jgi:hypothetical protein
MPPPWQRCETPGATWTSSRRSSRLPECRSALRRADGAAASAGQLA